MVTKFSHLVKTYKGETDKDQVRVNWRETFFFIFRKFGFRNLPLLKYFTTVTILSIKNKYKITLKTLRYIRRYAFLF